MASVSHSSASVPLSLSSRSSHRMHPSTGPLASSSSSHANPGGWSLPPLNQFMTLPRRFMPSNFGVFMDNGVTRGSQNVNGNTETAILNRSRIDPANSTAMDNLLNETEAEHVALNHFLLPPVVHYESNLNDAAASPLHHPEEIDLTFSSDEDEDGGQIAPDSSDVIEILDISEPPGVSVPLCRKRRRSETNANAVLVSKRQHIADMMKSAESTNINLHNSEVVEEFKRRLKCSICLDVLEDMTSTLCGHIFCAGCIHQAIRASGKCPLCQRRLHLKDTHRLYF